MRDVAEAMASRQDIVEDPSHINVAVVKRKPTGLVRRHGLQEIRAYWVGDIADAGLHSIPFFEQLLDDVAADEPCRSSDCDSASSGNGRHGGVWRLLRRRSAGMPAVRKK